MRRLRSLLVGITSLLASGCFGLLLLRYLSDGAGLQVFDLGLSGASVLMGVVHVVGFSLGCALTLLLGIYWCAEGLVPYREGEPNAEGEAKMQAQDFRPGAEG
jgi:hypothetical protein